MSFISSIFCGYGARHVDQHEVDLSQDSQVQKKDQQGIRGLQESDGQQDLHTTGGQGGETGEGVADGQLNTSDGSSNEGDGPSKADQNAEQKGIVDPDSGGTSDISLSKIHVPGNLLRRGSSTEVGSMSAPDLNESMSSSSVEHDHSALGHDDNVRQNNQRPIQPNIDRSSKTDQKTDQKGIVIPDGEGTPDPDLSKITDPLNTGMWRGSSSQLSMTSTNSSRRDSLVEADRNAGANDNDVQLNNQHVVQPNQSKQTATKAIVPRRTPDFIPVPGPRIEAMPGFPATIVLPSFDGWTGCEAGKTFANVAKLDALSQLPVDSSGKIIGNVSPAFDQAFTVFAAGSGAVVALVDAPSTLISVLGKCVDLKSATIEIQKNEEEFYKWIRELESQSGGGKELRDLAKKARAFTTAWHKEKAVTEDLSARVPGLLRDSVKNPAMVFIFFSKMDPDVAATFHPLDIPKDIVSPTNLLTSAISSGISSLTNLIQGSKEITRALREIKAVKAADNEVDRAIRSTIYKFGSDLASEVKEWLLAVGMSAARGYAEAKKLMDLLLAKGIARTVVGAIQGILTAVSTPLGSPLAAKIAETSVNCLYVATVNIISRIGAHVQEKKRKRITHDKLERMVAGEIPGGIPYHNGDLALDGAISQLLKTPSNRNVFLSLLSTLEIDGHEATSIARQVDEYEHASEEERLEIHEAIFDALAKQLYAGGLIDAMKDTVSMGATRIMEDLLRTDGRQLEIQRYLIENGFSATDVQDWGARCEQPSFTERVLIAADHGRTREREQDLEYVKQEIEATLLARLNQGGAHDVVNQGAEQRTANQAGEHAAGNVAVENDAVNQAAEHDTVNQAAEHDAANQAAEHDPVKQTAKHDNVNASLSFKRTLHWERCSPAFLERAYSNGAHPHHKEVRDFVQVEAGPKLEGKELKEAIRVARYSVIVRNKILKDPKEVDRISKWPDSEEGIVRFFKRFHLNWEKRSDQTIEKSLDWVKENLLKDAFEHSPKPAWILDVAVRGSDFEKRVAGQVLVRQHGSGEIVPGAREIKTLKDLHDIFTAHGRSKADVERGKNTLLAIIENQTLGLKRTKNLWLPPEVHEAMKQINGQAGDKLLEGVKSFSSALLAESEKTAKEAGVEIESPEHMKGAARFNAVKANLQKQRMNGHLDMPYLRKALLGNDKWKSDGARQFLSEILADHVEPKQGDAYKADPMNYVSGIGLDLRQVKKLASSKKELFLQAQSVGLHQDEEQIYAQIVTGITNTADRHRKLREKTDEELMALLKSKHEGGKALSILRKKVEKGNAAALPEFDEQAELLGYAWDQGAPKDKDCVMEHFKFWIGKRKDPPTASYSAKLTKKLGQYAGPNRNALVDAFDSFVDTKIKGTGVLLEKIRAKGNTRDQARMTEFLCAFNGKKDLPKRILNQIGSLNDTHLALLDELGSLKREGRTTRFEDRLNEFLSSSRELSMADVVTVTLAMRGVMRTTVERWRAYHGKDGASTKLYASKAALHDDIRRCIGEKGQVRAGLFDSPLVNAALTRGLDLEDLTVWLKEHAPVTHSSATVKNELSKVFDWMKKHPDKVAAHLVIQDRAEADVRQAQRHTVDRVGDPVKENSVADSTVRGALERLWLAKDDPAGGNVKDTKDAIRCVAGWMERCVLVYEPGGADRETVQDALELLVGWAKAPVEDDPADVGPTEKIKHKVISAEAEVCARNPNPDAIHARLCDLLAGKPPPDFNLALARKILEKRRVPGFLINWWLYQLDGKDTVLNFLGRDKKNRARILEEMRVALNAEKENLMANLDDLESAAKFFAKTTSHIYSPDTLIALCSRDGDARKMAMATLKHDMGLGFGDEAMALLVTDEEAEIKSRAYTAMRAKNMEPLESRREALCKKMTSRYERVKRWRSEPPGANKLAGVCMSDPAMVRSYLVAVRGMSEGLANGLVDSAVSRGAVVNRKQFAKAFGDAYQTCWIRGPEKQEREKREMEKREMEKKKLEQDARDAVNKEPIDVNAWRSLKSGSAFPLPGLWN